MTQIFCQPFVMLTLRFGGELLDLRCHTPKVLPVLHPPIVTPLENRRRDILLHDPFCQRQILPHGNAVPLYPLTMLQCLTTRRDVIC